MNKIKSLKGWVVCITEKKRTRIVCPYFNEEKLIYEGICGFGEIYYRCRQAKEICAELNDNWEGRPFTVRKAKLEVEE